MSLLPKTGGAVEAGSLSAALPEAGAAPDAYRQDKPLLVLQQAFLELRFGMFIHFNMATFQDREWGDPLGPTQAFNPAALDTDQWAQAALSAGMQYGCLTTKHHDGFCLWPTKVRDGADSILQTSHKTDVVRAYVDSFRRAGIRVCLYYSILDLRGDIRHFNVTPEKIARIKAQLTELLTNYGEIDMLIFDGWDAPWSRIPYDEVPFHEIYALIKSLQPNCLVSELNAASYPAGGLFYSDIKAYEQNAGQALAEGNLLPAQSCVTLTDGWFWKQSDKDAELKSARQVVHEWLIPQNNQHCNLICNAAPGRDGKFAPNIVARLAEIGKLWKASGERGKPVGRVGPSPVITTSSLAHARPIRAIASGDTSGPDLLNDDKFGNSWYLPEGLKEGWIEIDLPEGSSFNTLMIAEPIGRWKDYDTTRLDKYRWDIKENDTWRELITSSVPHAVRLDKLPQTAATTLRLTIWASADTPHLAEIGVYDEPARG